jgi:peptidyl-prolyl cis-trans isomerase A (cyclophilin A)
MKKALLFAGFLAVAAGCGPASEKQSVTAPPPMPTGPWQPAAGLKGTFAVMDTEKGRIVCKLYGDKAPNTVANFVGLASGTKEFKDAATNAVTKRKYYDGTKFFRVIPGFMIQGGDQTNTGTGGPGYSFDDEVQSGLTFDKPGLLAMANAGLKADGHGTNGSQFFLTDRPRNGIGLPTHLNGHHTIFGEVIEGLDVVSAIADVPTEGDHALQPVTLTHVDIVVLPK